jgi:hypothetical protein
MFDIPSFFVTNNISLSTGFDLLPPPPLFQQDSLSSIAVELMKIITSCNTFEQERDSWLLNTESTSTISDSSVTKTFFVVHLE